MPTLPTPQTPSATPIPDVQTPTAQPVTNQAAPNTYTVEKGDTLNNIAARLGFKNYKDANFSGYKSMNPNLILPGEVLSYSGTAPTKTSPNALSTDSIKGDILAASKDLNANVGAMNAANPARQPAQKEVSTTDPMGTGDEFTAMLDRMGQRSDSATRALISSIQAKRQNSANEINRTYDSYKRGLQLLGIQGNEAQATPEILMQSVLSKENERKTKLQELDNEETKAIIDAQTAKSESDFRLFKERMDYVRELKKEKANVLKDMADKMNAIESVSEDLVNQSYQALNSVPSNKREQLLMSISETYNIPLGALTNALAKRKMEESDKNLDRESKNISIQRGRMGLTKDSLDIQKSKKDLAKKDKVDNVIEFTKAQNAKLAGIGVAAGDITVIQDLLNTEDPETVFDYIKGQYGRKVSKELKNMMTKK